MAHCINVNSKELQSLSQTMNIKPVVLTAAIQEWQNDHNLDTFPSEQYLNKYFKLSGQSTTQFKSLQDFENAVKLWDRSYSKTRKFDNEQDALEYFNTAVIFFGKDNVGIVPTNEGTFLINVLKPVKNVTGNTFDTELDIKLQEKLEELFPNITLDYTYTGIVNDRSNRNLKNQMSGQLQRAQKQATDYFFDYLYKRNPSRFEIEMLNERLRSISNTLGDAPWHVAISKRGTYYIAGYNRQSVTSDSYYSPHLHRHYQKSGSRIIGQANLKALTVLIDYINQNQDTLPHEYAHHYISWFRDAAIVQRAIKQYGSEEALVQAVGELTVNKKGEASSWWKRFTNYVKLQFSKITGEDKALLTDYVTDAFLRNKNLGLIKTNTGIYNQTISEMRDSFYGNRTLKASEREYLARQAIVQFSNILDELQGVSLNKDSKAANQEYFGDLYEDVDFSTMTRREIIAKVSPKKIFDTVRDKFFDPLEREDITDQNVLDQLEIAHEGFYELLNSAYHKLIEQEHITINNSNSWIDNVESEDVDAVLDTITDGENTTEAWTRSFTSVSVRDSLSPLIKRALDKIRERDAQGKVILDKYGMETLLSTDVVYNTILQSVNTSLTIQQMEAKLLELQEVHPWMKDILDLIKKEPFRSQFYQNFRKDAISYSVITKELDEEGNVVYKPFIVNTSDVKSDILSSLRETIKEGEISFLTNVDPIDGKATVNLEEIASLKNKIDKLIADLRSNSFSRDYVKAYTKKNKREIEKLFKQMGISINSIALEGLLNSFNTNNPRVLLDNSTAYKILSNLQQMVTKLAKTNVRIDILGSAGVKSYYEKIADLMQNILASGVESSTYENGKLYYSYVTPSYLGKLILNLKNTQNDQTKFREFMEKEYLQYDFFLSEPDAKGEREILNAWIAQLSSLSQLGEDARKSLAHKVQLNFNDVNYNDLSALDYTLSLMQEFFYDDKDGKEGKEAWYHVPILADKPSAEFIKFKRYTNSTQTAPYLSVINNHLKNVAIQELRRMRAILERVNNGDIETINSFDPKLSKELKEKRNRNERITAKDLIGLDNSAAGGFRFKFLDFLNPLLSEQKVLDYIDKGEDVSHLHTTLLNAISKGMEAKFKNAMRTWEQVGALEKTSINEEERYLHLNKLGTTREEVEEKLRNYFYNSYLATTNIIQLTVTDIAFYAGPEDFQKRYAQVHSPALRLNVFATDKEGNRYSKDGVEKTMYIKDEEIASDLVEMVSRIFDDKIANATSKAEKAGYEKIKEDAIAGFNKVNVTDAQAFITLKGLRKKLGMAGKWDDNMQAAYESIQKGNWDLSTVNVLWQPMKPFVYTQIAKNGYNKVLSKLKVPVQNKNSEFLLLMTAALAQGGANTRLKALSEFMDENDIDSIQFDSTVKSGKQGVININSFTSPEQIKEHLEKHLYEKDTDGKAIVQNGEKKHNEQYVHKISFEDYGIQQEVPEHLTDASQLFGTQIRKLILADITPGSIFSVAGKDMDKATLVNHYQSLIAANLEEDYNTLIEDLGLNKADSTDKNKILSKLLIDEINSNGRYGSDLLRAVTLNEQGEFTVPLSDPMHSYRIQQLLNSIIKSRLTKQKIKGGAVVQVAPYGMNDDLKIVFNEDGSIKHFECYIPIPSEKWKELLQEVDEKGNISYNINKRDEKGNLILPEEMRKFVGYRIPTEDKYSMAPLYIKGFLPSQSGSAIMLPKEITLLSGSDYDIDKLYVMLPEFKAVGNTIKKVEYISEANLRSYQNYVLQNINKDTRKEFKETKERSIKQFFQDQFDSFKSLMNTEAKEALKEAKESLKTDSGAISIIDNLNKIRREQLKELPDYIRRRIGKLKTELDEESIIGASKAQAYLNLTQALLNDTKDNELKQKLQQLVDLHTEELQQYGFKKETIEKAKQQIKENQSEAFASYKVNKTAIDRHILSMYEELAATNKLLSFEKFKEDFKQSPYLFNNRQARNNELIDIMYSILTHKDTASKIFNPGSFDVQKQSARRLIILKSGLNYTYADLAKMNLDQLDKIIKENGLDSKVTIPDPTTQVYFHQQNTIAGKLIGIFANHNTSHALLQGYGIHYILKDNIVFSGEIISDDTNIDEMAGQDGYTLITKTIAGFLAASVDAVKDPVLNFMNLNTFTANVAMLLARLGYDSDSIGLLLTQPSIENLTRDYFTRNNSGYIKGEDVIDLHITEQLKKLGGNVSEQSILENLKNNPFKKTALAENLNINDPSFQLDVLVLFKQFMKMADDLNTLTFITKFDTSSNAAGPLFADTLSKQVKKAKFLKKQQGKKATMSGELFKAIQQPIISDFANRTFLASQNAAEGNFIHYNDDVVSLIELVSFTVGETTDAKLLNSLINDFIAYKLTMEYADGNILKSVFSGKYEDRQNFLLKFPKEVKDRIAADPSLLDNYLLKKLTTKSSNKRVPMMTLEIKTGGLSVDEKEALKNGWADLMLDEKTKDLALNLVKYNFYKSGFNFSPTSFMHLVPIEVKQQLPGYLESLNNNTYNTIFNNTDPVEFLRQYKRNHLENKRLVPLYSMEENGIRRKGNVLNVDVNSTLGKKLEATEKKGVKVYVDVIQLEETVNGKKVTFPWILTNMGTLEYTKSHPLGIKGHVLEYDATAMDMKSAITNNLKGNTAGGQEEVALTHEQGVDLLSKDNKEIIDTILAKITGKTTEQINQTINRKEDKRTKIIKLLRSAYSDFGTWDKNRQNNMIAYFEKVKVKDAEGKNIC